MYFDRCIRTIDNNDIINFLKKRKDEIIMKTNKFSINDEIKVTATGDEGRIVDVKIVEDEIIYEITVLKTEEVKESEVELVEKVVADEVAPEVAPVAEAPVEPVTPE